MDKDRLKKQLPMYAVIVVGILAVVLLFTYAVVPKSGPQSPSAEARSVSQIVPDGESEDIQSSKTEAYRTPGGRRTHTIDEYFSTLPDTTEDEISLVTESPATPKETSGARKPETSESAVARVLGQSPASESEPSPTGTTVQQTPRQTVQTRSPQPRTPQEQLDLDRQRAEMIRDVIMTNQPEQTAQKTDEKPATTEQKEELLETPLEISDPAISTWDDERPLNSSRNRPIRCMFINNEKIKNHQRITLRILEEYATGSIRIPANSHLQAIAEISERLCLTINSFEYNGYIIPLALEAFDIDGLKGIYCPNVSSAAKTAQSDAISTTGTAVGGLVGDLANSILRTGATIARNAAGEVSVSVNSGYEFFLVKKEKR